MPELFVTYKASKIHYTVTTMDERGRLASRSPLRALGWEPSWSIGLIAVKNLIVVNRKARSQAHIDRQGFLRLPASIRHRCRLIPGGQLLVVACPDDDRIVVCPAPVLDEVLRDRFEFLDNVVSS